MSVQAPVKFIQMQNIWKRFPGVVANEGIDLDLRSGEVHALLGENGAGKTTLMNILAGTLKADQGEIWIEGRKVEIDSPAIAIQHGIGMVHQNFRLVDDLTVAENIHLGWSETPWHVSHERLGQRLKKITAELQYDVDPRARIWQLSVGEQQRVEILKVLSRGVGGLILDEPTAVLTPMEIEELFRAVRTMAKNGKSIVFISHKLEEVLEISDRITVLRDGARVATENTADCDARMLARLMVGKEMVFGDRERQGAPGETILAMESVDAENDRGLPALRGVDLMVGRREIFGIAGVAGNGQRELAEVATGLRSIKSGRIRLEGFELSGCSPAEFARAGVGHIPEDRLGMGLFSSLSITHNAILRVYRDPPIRRGMRLLKRWAFEFANGLVQRGDVRLPNVGVKLATLSGGNQQKLLTRREIEIASKLLVAVHPTRGLDIAASQEVRGALMEHRNKGNAVLLISEDLHEIFLLCDRFAVMYDGRILGDFETVKASREDVGLLMGGKTPPEDKAA